MTRTPSAVLTTREAISKVTARWAPIAVPTDRASEEPLEFPHTKAVTDDAQVALAEMAREKLPNGKRADFGVKVEDEAGREVYRAGLYFEAKTEEDIASERCRR